MNWPKLLTYEKGKLFLALNFEASSSLCVSSIVLVYGKAADLGKDVSYKEITVSWPGNREREGGLGFMIPLQNMILES